MQFMDSTLAWFSAGQNEVTMWRAQRPYNDDDALIEQCNPIWSAFDYKLGEKGTKGCTCTFFGHDTMTRNLIKLNFVFQMEIF